MKHTKFSTIEKNWDPANLDLEAYLKRINYTGPRLPTAAVLAAIHRAHTQAIPFENIDVLIGHGINVGLPNIEHKLVDVHRGGYCFEQNPLLAAALTRLGFSVVRSSARGPMGPEQDSPIYYSCGHAMLLVEAEEQTYLCDVGVGYLGSTQPIPLIDGGEFDDGNWRYRTDRVEAGPQFTGWMLRIRLHTGWSNIYAFSENPVFHADYTTQNFIATDHPDSPFPNQLIVQRTGPEERRSLRNLELTLRRANEESVVQEILPNDLPEILSTQFNLLLDGDTMVALEGFVDSFARTTR